MNFPRCASKRSDGARCWLLPEHEGKHLVIKPGEVPTATVMAKVVAARPDLDRDEVVAMVAMEPVGLMDALAEYRQQGHERHGFNADHFLKWNRSRNANRPKRVSEHD